MFTTIVSTFLLAGHHLRLLLRSKRTLLVMAIVGLGPLIAGLTIDPSAPMRHAIPVAMLLVPSVLGPLAGLIMGSSVLSEDVEAKTLTFLFTRPIPRPSLFLGRLFACVWIVCTFLGLAAWWIGSQAEALPKLPHSADPAGVRFGNVPDGFTQQFVLASVFAGAMYCTIAGVLSTLLRRPIVVGLGYAFVLEMVIGNLPGSTQRMSMQYYLRGVLFDGHSEKFLPKKFLSGLEFLSAQESVWRLSLALVVMLVIGTLTIRRKQFLLSE